jgi:nitrate/TMAO reductase-like tetraheme cytochrome c subunit
VKAGYSQVLLVDDGGFFPEVDNQRDYAWFLMDAMKMLGTDGVSIGERDLRFGLAYLKSQQKRTGLPVVCANLLEKKSQKSVFPPFVIKRVGGLQVGIFGLIGDKIDLGPAKDSLMVSEPSAAARKTIAELKKKGVNVIVLLSQLGKVESEDLVSATEGVDAVIVGHNTPMIEKGRMIKNTVACYGGDQGQFVCRTELTLDDKKHSTSGDAAAIMLGPEVGEKPEVLKLVKSFEDGFNEKIRKEELENAKKQAAMHPSEAADHYLGSEVCVRCHADEGAQWKTTAHSAAWATLQEVKKDATPECIPCHVVGFNKPGGFVNGTSTPQLGNVQCESCHGMGTQHNAFAANPTQLNESTCKQCHNPERDPDFNFEKRVAMIVHSNTSGESLKNVQQKMKEGNSPMMKGHGTK